MIIIDDYKNEQKISSETGVKEKKFELKELEKKTAANLKLSADDIIEKDFTPEQRRAWAQIMMGSTLSPKSSNKSDSTELSTDLLKP